MTMPSSSKIQGKKGKATEGQGKLRPRARLLNSIGAELISSEVVAVIELIRNCYDADAKNVIVSFTGLVGEAHPELSISDDGHGMTREVLLGPWMEPATDYKSGKAGGHAGERSPEGRRRLGSKGVGRFASQRLGAHLELTTRAAGTGKELHATVNWADIERPGTYLDEFVVPWIENDIKSPYKSGTTLKITKLRDSWTPERFEKLKVALARLVSPDWMGDSFEITLEVEGREERIRSVIDRTRPMYSLAGSIDANGVARMTWGDLQGNEEEWEREVLWPSEERLNSGPFSFRFSAWDLDRGPLLHYLQETKSPLGLREFRQSLREHSGISLYRDGFRILPYGEPDNDWLRLDRRRVNNPTLRLSNNQLVGVITLTADDNPELRDQTNREGLVANPGYEHLRDVVCELLSYFENRRFAARRGNELGIVRDASMLPDLTSDLDEKIDTMLEGLAAGRSGARSKDLREAISERRQAEAETLRIYSGLATTGQMSSMVFSQLEHFVRRIQSEVALVRGDVSFDSLDKGAIEDLRMSMGAIDELLHQVRGKMQRLDPLAKQGKSRRLRKIRLGDCVAAPLEAFQDRLAESEVTVEVLGDGDLMVNSNIHVIQQAMAPILDNALYWVGQRAKERNVLIELEPGTITISNNGPAIPEEDEARIFLPHFTRRPDASGLGLTLAANLMESVGGEVVHSSYTDYEAFTIRAT